MRRVVHRGGSRADPKPVLQLGRLMGKWISARRGTGRTGKKLCRDLSTGGDFVALLVSRES